MQAHGLYPPGHIKVTGKFVRFPGREKPKSNRSGWYLAPVTEDVVFFGDYSQGLSTYFRDQDFKLPPQDEWKKRKARQRRIESDERKRAASALDEMKRVWASASMDPAGHPYLIDKEIDPSGCQVKRYRDADGKDVLLFPMFVGRQLVGVQKVFANREKRFWSGMSGWAGASNQFGKRSKTTYICEGWATGWSIWRATGDMTLVCYTLSNMANVVERAVAKLDGEIVIAADNDRWSVFHSDGEKPNPGCHHARMIAADHEGVRVAVPDFVRLDEQPTDFDDLRRLEGPEAVLRWLDPSEAGRATTTPPPDPDEVPELLADAPFIVRGIKDGDRYMFVRVDSGAIRTFTANQLYQQPNLCSLASAPFWDTFIAQLGGAEGKKKWEAIGHYLQQQSEMKKVSAQVRCMGVWRDPSGIVVHVGNDLQLADGTWTKPWLCTSAHYVQLPDDEHSLPRFGPPATVDETRDIHAAISERWPWKVEASGYLVSGWTMLVPVANCLKWRPHIWVNGDAGAGKSELMKFINDVSHFCRYHEGGTTPAGLRRELGKEHALSCILDEFEPSKNRAERSRLFDSTIELIRKCSSGESILQAQGEKTVSYRTRSMFLCASIAGAVSSVQDVQRFSVCELEPPGEISDKDEFQQWRGHMDDTIEGGLPDRVLARTVQMLRDGTLARTIKTFRAVFLGTSESARQADQLGTLMAGSWLMRNDDPPSENEAREEVMSLVWDEAEDAHGAATERQQRQADGRDVLNMLLQAPVLIGLSKEHATLGQVIVDVLFGGESNDDHKKALDQHFVRVRDGRVLFGQQSLRLRKALQDSIYTERWWRLLAGLPGAETPGSRHGGRISFGGVRTMCVSLPADLFLEDE